MTELERRVWLNVTALGDSSVLLPCIALLALCLLASASTRVLAWYWMLAVAGAMALVIASKLAFMAWGVSLPGLDFTGLSGHTAMAALVWPALGGLLAARAGRWWQGFAVLSGMALALAVGCSRVALSAHSVSEVVLGYGVGAGFVSWLFRRHGREWRLPWSPFRVVLPMLAVLPLVYGHRFPSQDILRTVATHMTDGPLHTRHELRMRRQQSNPPAARPPAPLRAPAGPARPL